MGQRTRVLVTPDLQVAKLYRDPSIGNSINIVVSKLVILTEDKVSGNELTHIIKGVAFTSDFS